MTSLRHNGSTGSTRDGYLDAARGCILDVGLRRTTLTEVARRAGVSRMTIYRSWPDMDRLLGDLMTREWADVVAATLAAEPAGGDAPTRIAHGIVATVRSLRDNELFVRIVELDPDVLLPYLLARRGRSQEAIVGLTADWVRRGQEAGEVRPGDPLVIARTLALSAHGFVLSVHTMTDDDVSSEALDEEFRAVLERGLRP